jgi:hypothetical protein
MKAQSRSRLDERTNKQDRRTDQIYQIKNILELQTKLIFTMHVKNIQESCNSVLTTVRQCNLNYCIQETPYSLLLTIRKSFSKNKYQNSDEEIKAENFRNDVSTSDTLSYKVLKEAFEKLENDFQAVVKDSVEKDRRIEELLVVVSDTETKYRFTEARLSESIEKNKVQQKEKVKFEKEKEAISGKLNISEEKLEQLPKLNKEYKAIEKENEKLNMSNDEMKEELKYSENTILNLSQELNRFKNIKSDENSCQTDCHPDIPYRITSPLPPIFSSQLCFKSRPIFLSKSLPNLEMVWCRNTAEDFTDEAEEALSEMYDRQICDFYEDERECVREARVAGVGDDQHQAEPEHTD